MTLRAFLVRFSFLDEPEMASALPDYVRPPVWMASQKFTYRFFLATQPFAYPLPVPHRHRGPGSTPKCALVRRMF